MIVSLQNEYFHKSWSFLFPLLGLRRDQESWERPVSTHIAWSDRYQPEDRRLIVVYENHNHDPWYLYLSSNICALKSFEQLYTTQNEEHIIAVFNLEHRKEDMDAFLSGKYSRMSDEARNVIRQFYGVTSTQWAYLETFLYPEKHFRTYAILLGQGEPGTSITEESLREIGELCDPYDLAKETLQLVAENKKVVNNSTILT